MNVMQNLVKFSNSYLWHAMRGKKLKASNEKRENTSNCAGLVFSMFNTFVEEYIIGETYFTYKYSLRN